MIKLNKCHNQQSGAETQREREKCQNVRSKKKEEEAIKITIILKSLLNHNSYLDYKSLLFYQPSGLESLSTAISFFVSLTTECAFMSLCLPYSHTHTDTRPSVRMASLMKQLWCATSESTHVVGIWHRCPAPNRLYEPADSQTLPHWLCVWHNQLFPEVNHYKYLAIHSL